MATPTGIGNIGAAIANMPGAKPAAKKPAASAPQAAPPTTPFIEGVLKDIGAPVTANTVEAMTAWVAAENGKGNNLLNIKDSKGGFPTFSTPEDAAKATAAVLNQTNMAVIKESLTANQSPANIKDATIQSPWDQNHYAGTTYGGEPAINYQQSTAGSTPAVPAVSAPTYAAPMAGVNIKNFHGYDLTAFEGSNELGNAEAQIEKFTTGPNAGQLRQRLQQDFGYTTNWALAHPDAAAVMIWAGSFDPTSTTGKAELLSYLQKTPWFQTTDENKRAFEAAESTDPAKAKQAITDAYDKVEATANQIGVSLTAAQAQAIARTYAAQAYTPEGTLGAVSGTSQEQLDQLVISAVTTVQKNGVLPGVDTTATFKPGAAGTAPTAGTGGGIESQLFQSLKGIAQSYLMYSSSPSSPLTDADLQKYVASYLQQYTGSGSYGSSNLMNGANQSFTSLMQQQAAALYPALADPIKQGTTAQNYTAPIQNLIANTMGLVGGSTEAPAVDLTSPKWNWAIKADPETGAPLTQDAILAKLTTMPEYQQTDNAKNTAHSIINGMSQMLGTGGA